MRVNSSGEAEALVASTQLAGSRHDFVVISDRTETHAFGWVIYFAPRAFVETGDERKLVPGTGPVVVTREGDVIALTTSMPPSAAVAAFEKAWRAR